MSKDTTQASPNVVEDEEKDSVVADLQRYLSSPSTSLFDATATAVPVAAIKTLLGVVVRSRSETMMGLQNELESAAERMQTEFQRTDSKRSSIALQSGCALFLKYVTRTFLEQPGDFDAVRREVIERGERFQMISLAARDRIAAAGRDFIPPNSVVLTHGWSRVVAATLKEASMSKHFDLIVLEGRPDASGLRAAKSYAEETTIPTTVAPDTAMAAVMEKVDVVLIGAEGVLENGGIVNKIGTYALAVCAMSAGKPVYVAAESYKFARLYPLDQSDVPSQSSTPLADDLPDSVAVYNPSVDFTPAKFITLLFTDLGVLTPSAVSDELIRLYQ